MPRRKPKKRGRRHQYKMREGAGVVVMSQGFGQLMGKVLGFLILGVDRRFHAVTVLAMGIERAARAVGENLAARKPRCGMNGVFQFNPGPMSALCPVDAGS